MDGNTSESHTPTAGAAQDQVAAGARRPGASASIGSSHVAVVCGPRGVLFLSVADSAVGRDAAVARYVRRRASHQLAPGTCDRVLALLDGGDAAAAVALYFDAVGEEWDREWLHLAVVPRLATAGGRGRPRMREARR